MAVEMSLHGTGFNSDMSSRDRDQSLPNTHSYRTDGVPFMAWPAAVGVFPIRSLLRCRWAPPWVI